ncbi:MAG: hypothetical protein RBS32_05240 [Aliarcobacter sp.]|jgi:hypothetical protein|nr:hypothetical protein [Aliarcobacter sp.]
MSKNPINKTILSKTIRTTQAIEGYKEADKQTILKAQNLREKYGIKVSAKR